MVSELERFLRQPTNSVVRERIFYNRLYFDLKLAAAMRGYALKLYEPEVDRDGYDIVLDDEDNARFVQLKTVLADAKTATWNTSKRFLRPALAYSEALNLAPADCGRGGAVVLITIDLTSSGAEVSYKVTDYFIMRILASGMLAKTGTSSDLGSRRVLAERSWLAVHQGSPADPIALTKGVFLRARDPSGVLALLGLHSTNQCYLPADKFLQARRDGFRVDASGRLDPSTSGFARAAAELCCEEVLLAANEPRLIRNPDLNRKALVA